MSSKIAFVTLFGLILEYHRGWRRDDKHMTFATIFKASHEVPLIVLHQKQMQKGKEVGISSLNVFLI